MADALDLLEIGDGGSLDGSDGLEVRQQRGARLFTDAGNGGQGGGVGLFLHGAFAVVVGIAVRLVLDVRNKGKNGTYKMSITCFVSLSKKERPKAGCSFSIKKSFVNKIKRVHKNALFVFIILLLILFLELHKLLK